MVKKTTTTKPIERYLKKIDDEINRLWEEYRAYHEDLNKHRGKLLENTDLDDVNKVLNNICTTFAELYPALHFIAVRYQFANNATNSYNEFVEQIKKGGAVEQKI